MELERLDGEWSVCRLWSLARLDLTAPYLFVGKTDGELSAVCPTGLCSSLDCEKREDGWRGFRVAGTLDFSLIGGLSGISSVLAAEGIGIFVISTYDTDYVWVKGEQWAKAAAALERKGYRFRP